MCQLAAHYRMAMRINLSLLILGAGKWALSLQISWVSSAWDGCVRRQSAPTAFCLQHPTASLHWKSRFEAGWSSMPLRWNTRWTLSAKCCRYCLGNIISDIASGRDQLKKFYEESGFRYVSTHPMFGPLLPASTIWIECHHHQRRWPLGKNLLQGPPELMNWTSSNIHSTSMMRL